MIIAVDGPAAAGKGTLARALAERLGLAHLDTGLTYRAVAAKLLAAGRSLEDETEAAAIAAALTEDDLARPDLRSEAVGRAASVIAARPAVRLAIRGFQRSFAHHPPDGKPGCVLDGRDIGTVVCPDADVKLFVTASPQERALRRHKELMARGEASIYERVLAEMRERDARDSQRAVAPLRPARDAVTVDTTELDAEAALAAALGVVAEKQAANRTMRP